MSEKQAFGVLVRAVGVLVFLDGLKALWFAFAEWVLPSVREMPFALIAPSLIFGLGTITLGFAMIRWPQRLVHIAWMEKLPTVGRME